MRVLDWHRYYSSRPMARRHLPFRPGSSFCAPTHLWNGTNTRTRDMSNGAQPINGGYWNEIWSGSDFGSRMKKTVIQRRLNSINVGARCAIEGPRTARTYRRLEIELTLRWGRAT